MTDDPHDPFGTAPASFVPPAGVTVGFRIYLLAPAGGPTVPPMTVSVFTFDDMTIVPRIADDVVCSQVVASAIRATDDMAPADWRLMTAAEVRAYQVIQRTPDG